MDHRSCRRLRVESSMPREFQINLPVGNVGVGAEAISSNKRAKVIGILTAIRRVFERVFGSFRTFSDSPIVVRGKQTPCTICNDNVTMDTGIGNEGTSRSSVTASRSAPTKKFPDTLTFPRIDFTENWIVRYERERTLSKRSERSDEFIRIERNGTNTRYFVRSTNSTKSTTTLIDRNEQLDRGSIEVRHRPR